MFKYLFVVFYITNFYPLYSSEISFSLNSSLKLKAIIQDQSVIIFEENTEKILKTFKTNKYSYKAVISPDNKFIFVLSYEYIQIINIDTCENLFTIKTEFSHYNVLINFADNIIFLVYDYQIRIYNYTSNELIKIIKTDYQINKSLITPDGKKIIIVSDYVVKIYNSVSREIIKTIESSFINNVYITNSNILRIYNYDTNFFEFDLDGLDYEILK